MDFENDCNGVRRLVQLAERSDQPGEARFTNHRRPIKVGMQIYLWTDGIIDQVGGPRRLGFGKRRLQRILLDYGSMGMARRKAETLREFVEYQDEEARRDDITFIGFVPRWR